VFAVNAASPLLAIRPDGEFRGVLPVRDGGHELNRREKEPQGETRSEQTDEAQRGRPLGHSRAAPHETHEEERAEETRLDWTGFLALAIAIGAAQLMLDRGQRQDWFESTEIVIEAAIAIVAFYLFVVHSLSHARPFLDPRLLLDRNFALGLVFVFVMGMLSFAPLVLFPPLLQELRNYPDSLVGTLLAARGIGNWISFLVVVQLTRYNAKLALVSTYNDLVPRFHALLAREDGDIQAFHLEVARIAAGDAAARRAALPPGG